MLSKVPAFIQKLPWQKHIWRIPVKTKTVFLTFDDGPTPGVTEKVIDILNDFNASATFFCLGRNAEHYPELIEKIKEHKHRIGNHSYSHLKGFKISTSKYIDDIKLANSFFMTTLFRPPYGRIRRRQAKKLSKHFTIIMWEILSYDYSQNVTSHQCYENVINNVKPGSVIVFHDSLKASSNILNCLPMVLKELTALGYDFKSIPDIY